VAEIVYSPNAIVNIERAFEYLAEKDPRSALAAASAIRTAVGVLARHPLIGRPVEDDLRELVISFGRTGYVALYRFVQSEKSVRVLAIRRQRELDYSG
jgi:plasmid stabilization system protein ParE